MLLSFQLGKRKVLPIYIFKRLKIQNSYDNIIKYFITGSTLSQLLNLLLKSKVITCPQTEVILKNTISPKSVPDHSCTGHAEFIPVMGITLYFFITLTRQI